MCTFTLKLLFIYCGYLFSQGKLSRKELSDTLEMEDTGESLDVDGFDYFDKKLPKIDTLMDLSLV